MACDDWRGMILSLGTTGTMATRTTRTRSLTSLLLIAVCFLASGPRGTSAFAFQKSRRTGTVSPLCMAVEIGPTDDDVDPPLPGQMKISEIKSELDLRQISHKDCFERDSLELRL